MYLTLEDLRDSVNRLIADLGKDAPCAGFVFTQYDVYKMDDNDMLNAPLDVAEKVLEAVGDDNYLYEVVGERIADQIEDHWG